MELIESLPFVKARPLTPSNAKVLKDVMEAVEEMKLIKEDKIEARNAEDLLNELWSKINTKIRKGTEAAS